MKRTATQAPPAQTVLKAHPPAPARIELMPRSRVDRLARTLVVLVLCWVPGFWMARVPPHFLGPLLGLGVGAWMAYRMWTGRFLVVRFSGVCPHCRRELSIAPGTSVDFPHALRCPGCRFEPRVEVALWPPAGRGADGQVPWIRHLHPDCTGSWTLHWFWEDPYLQCSGCHARFLASPEARRAAEEENRRGDLLERLAEEGRFLG